jgi:GDP-D-mannose 3',5'-epimerase
MIGSNLVRHLVGNAHDVHVVDNLWRGSLENLRDDNGAFIDLERSFHELDLSVPRVLDTLLATGFDAVFHLADVVAGIGYVFANEGSIFRQNVLINSNVIDSSRRHPPSAFVYVGTACSFPAIKQYGVDAPPLREEDQYPAAPESAYGWSKLMGEYEALLFEQETSVPVSVLSLHNVYGTPTDFEGSRSQVIPALVRKAIAFPQEPFVVWGDGSQGRAFVHVDDVVAALMAAVDRGLGAGVIQIGPDVCTSIRELAEMIVSISGKPIEALYDSRRPTGDGGRCADYSKANRVLGWAPQVDLASGVRDLYEWVERQLAEAPLATA